MSHSPDNSDRFQSMTVVSPLPPPPAGRRRMAALAVLGLLLASCGPMAPPLNLPPAANRLSQDPTSAALHGAAEAFSDPSRLQGRPGQAAIAVAQLEYLAVEIPSGRDLRQWGIVAPALQGARGEVRRYLGIPDAAPPQAVIDALTAAASAPAGDAVAPASLPPALFPAGGTEVWHRLAALPRLPQANAATSLALRSWEFGPLDVMDFASLQRR
jgi:predicted small lipoprotein YifL